MSFQRAEPQKRPTSVSHADRTPTKKLPRETLRFQ